MAKIGGIDPAVLIGRTVRLECGLVGVIALKALHLCEGDEDKKIPPIRELCIDIGAKDRAEAENTSPSAPMPCSVRTMSNSAGPASR